MLKHQAITINRCDNFLSQIESFLYPVRIPVEATYAQAQGRIPFKDAIHLPFSPISTGATLGPTWSTFWFKLNIQIPNSNEKWALLFDTSSEAMIWNEKGEPLQGITGGQSGDRHVDFPLSEFKGQTVIYVEVACNGMFGAGNAGFIQPPDMNRTFLFKTCELVSINVDAHSLFWDYQILLGIVKEFPKDSQGFADALFTTNQVVNAVIPGQPETIKKALTVSKAFLKARESRGYSEHEITAIGHCHIDTAWLWDYEETKRKIARSWATQCGLIEKYPAYKFTASQAQQFEWCEQIYPDLFERIKKHVKGGQFLPIGGTWVEMDCNIPSGESFCRQFYYGQKYFQKTFGALCKVFWLPDTFGYSAQLPQIVKESGLDYFFTQKLSWNNINKFPNSTFMWTGLDGTSVLTHFSPADTYCAQATVKEICFAVKKQQR